MRKMESAFSCHLGYEGKKWAMDKTWSCVLFRQVFCQILLIFWWQHNRFDFQRTAVGSRRTGGWIHDQDPKENQKRLERSGVYWTNIRLFESCNSMCVNIPTTTCQILGWQRCINSLAILSRLQKAARKHLNCALITVLQQIYWNGWRGRNEWMAKFCYRKKKVDSILHTQLCRRGDRKLFFMCGVSAKFGPLKAKIIFIGLES